MQLPTRSTPPTTNPNEYSYLIYGEPKVGKSTLASKFPNALFIATEQGHNFLDVYRLNPKTFTEVKKIAANLIKTKHKFETVIFDTADNLYLMAAREMCQKMGIEHQSDADFGKAYDRIKIELMRMINALMQHGLGVVFISHADTREIKDREMVSDGQGGHIVTEITKQKTDATLSGSARKIIRGMCDMIFYCYVDADGNRWMRTKQTDGIVAGDRSGRLPDVLPLDYDEFTRHLTATNTTNTKGE